MKYLKKNSFTLLEMLIGMALASIVLTLLFSTFRYSSIATSTTRVTQNCVHQRLCTQTRFSQIFDHLEFEIKKKPFYTGPHPDAIGDALYFKFYQGIDHDPQFIGTLTGALYINQKKQLCLESQSERGAIRKEIYLNNVKDLSFQLFDPHQATWETSWNQELSYSPAFIKLKLMEKVMKDSVWLEFAFILNGTHQEITYYKEQK